MFKKKKNPSINVVTPVHTYIGSMNNDGDGDSYPRASGRAPKYLPPPILQPCNFGDDPLNAVKLGNDFLRIPPPVGLPVHHILYGYQLNIMSEYYCSSEYGRVE